MRSALVEADVLNPALGLVAHSRRVAAVSRCIAELVGLDSAQADLIGQAAFFHDIGKLSVPAALLMKPAALEPGEWEAVRQHSKLGQMMLAEPNDAFRRLTHNIAAWHHECFDGSGYPDQLEGEAIPLEARIVALADVYDALRSSRSYKDAQSHRDACEIIKRGDRRIALGKFDPSLRDAFLTSDFAVSIEWDCAALKDIGLRMKASGASKLTRP
jgi:HD-GYP domain-containing protein (c-di-GMP phosphodiesterase class II)